MTHWLETSDIAEHARLALNQFEKLVALGDKDKIDDFANKNGFAQMNGEKENILKIVELGASQGRYDYVLHIEGDLFFVKETGVGAEL